MRDWYNDEFGASVTSDYLKSLMDYTDNYKLTTQPLKVKILNWDWKDGDPDWDMLSIYSPSADTGDLYDIE